jgi:hypothetical protein
MARTPSPAIPPPGYAQAGLTYVMIEPTDRERPDWLHSVETIVKAGGL